MCKNPATVRTDYACREAAMCTTCDEFVGEHFYGLFRLHIDTRECDALRLLRDAPLDKRDDVLQKLVTIINFPGHKVLLDLENKKEKINVVCENCPTSSIFMPCVYFRIVEGKNDDYNIYCKHKARELKTHTPCNACGVRFLNDNDIIKKARKAEHHYEPKLTCLLCQQEQTIVTNLYNISGD